MVELNEKDLQMIKSWYEGWGAPTPPDDAFPTLGFIENNAAAVFLYRTDSAVGYMEGTITNPEIDSTFRWEALKALYKRVEEEAPKHGVKYLVGMSTHPSLTNLVEQMGWRQNGMALAMVKEIA